MNESNLKITTPNELEIVMTRVFDAPRRLVFDAFTKPELVQRWLLGPDGWAMIVCEIDLRVGGAYRWVWKHEKNGTVMGMGGVYREVVPPMRIVSTEKFDEAWYEGEMVGTLEFTERDGKTTLTQSLRYASKSARDGVLKSGMETGVAASYDRLAKIFAKDGGATAGKRAQES